VPNNINIWKAGGYNKRGGDLSSFMVQWMCGFDTGTQTRGLTRKKIEKIVDLTTFGIKDTYNLAFGDLLPDGSIDDKANSNNGDIVKVLSTVIAILKDFTSTRIQANIVFTGSTNLRMKLYTRILRTYYLSFIKEFQIKAFVKMGDDYLEVDFDRHANIEYLVFLIKRIN
jgi:hypothetical protein